MANHFSGEEIIYCEFVELFRFDSVSRAWKGRCKGELRFLKSINLKKIRIVMRRDVTLKVCVNHFITADMKVSFKPANSAIWSAFDFSEEVLKFEIFAARFKTSQKAQNFNAVFEHILRLVKEGIIMSSYIVPVLLSPSQPYIGDAYRVARPNNVIFNATDTVSSEPIQTKISFSPQKEFQQRCAQSMKTVWSHHYFGDVEIAEICYNSVKGFCFLENSGCKLMHSHRYFHWQVREKEKPWVNLPEYHVIALERSFCDPEIDEANIPLLNPSKLNQDTIGLVTILKGRSQWEANFQARPMQLTLKMKNYFSNEISLELRRLSVPFSTFLWYFPDHNKNWIKYGAVDSTGNGNQVSSINSLDIENHLIAQPNSPLIFQISEFSYVLDVLNLVQTNLETNVSRDIKRRPKPDLNIGPRDELLTNDDLPVNWELMNATEQSRRVTLLKTSQEFKKVQALITQANRDKFNRLIIKIERIQNIFLYRAFQNKVRQMTSILKSKRAVAVQTLFHGTKSDTVLPICNENFDWRLYGTNVGYTYGKGAYFTSSPKMALKYAVSDSHGHKILFAAQVAVGSIVLGDSSMSRPPINPNTNLRYNSTVNSIAKPTIFVKYDDQEYYPEYLITTL